VGVVTGGIERFSANKNIRKILKVSHFYFKFSWSENHSKIEYSKRVSLEFSRVESKKSNGTLYTGGIENFSAKENFRKILKVSHFYSGFSPNKNNNEIKHSQKV